MVAMIFNFIGSLAVLLAAGMSLHSIALAVKAGEHDSHSDRCVAITAHSLQIIAMMAIGCGIKYALSS